MNAQNTSISQSSNNERAARLQVHGEPSGYLSSTILAVVAGGATWASFASIARQAAPDGLLVRMFPPAGDLVGRSVPTAILFLFFWTLAVLLWKGLRILRERSRLRHPLLASLPEVMAREGAAAAYASLAPRLAKRRPGLAATQLAKLIQLLRTSGDARRAHDSFRHQAQIAADTAAGSYTMTRVFIWAMPILGFIGTVLGIGLSVGAFAGFLTGDIDDIELVKSELSKIAGGLAFAFDTTLIGLVGSLLAMFATSFVQSADESFHTALEKLGVDVVSSFPETAQVTEAAPSDVDELGERIDALTLSLHALLEGVAGWRDASDALSLGIVRLSKNEAALLAQVTEASTALGTLASTVHRTSDGLGTTFGGLLDRIDTLATQQHKIAEALRVIDTFGSTISTLEATHREGQRIMKRLGGPLELRLVPLGAEG
ncbi:MotA/TolQ/ExbB proton channel family protein [Haliangium ochraceum]|uniref:MotA/TolQ/ExbB proton channel domain-containing protein n=1 Tax=Haliangium ochraceum (strain DSM 14365 / JCM 11303 / SMP-2) TaxID=502025 RepID=D0LS34_HALO1|nr:MotA/TolQ/ExbB proton channel family protein [Haliangium ochraceum]ACY13731.1 hypothetical protein Hoch_1161 [Haliangium ochraceum DSM 14365]